MISYKFLRFFSIALASLLAMLSALQGSETRALDFVQRVVGHGCSRCAAKAKAKPVSQSKKKQERLLLVIGCPRAGTTYIHSVLNRCNIPVGHEKDGEKGIVSWLFSADTDYPAWGPKPVDYHFKHIFHQVRHPLKCIATMHLVVSRAWEYIAREIPEIDLGDSRLVNCAKMWVYWNLKAEEKAEMTYRVESVKEAFPEISRRLKVDLPLEVLQTTSKKTHSARHEFVVTWQDLQKALEPAFYQKLVLLAQRYGYDVKEGLALMEKSPT